MLSPHPRPDADDFFSFSAVYDLDFNRVPLFLAAVILPLFFGTFNRTFGNVNDDRLIARILVFWQGKAFATDEGVLGFTDSTADIAFGKAVDGGQLELGMVMTQIA